MDDQRSSLLFGLVLRALVSPLFHSRASAGSGAEAKQGPRWMRAVLVAAGIYNLTWGGWVVFFLAAPFRWTGMAPTNCLQIWQCVGMIIGV
jgi:hypothetical protein